MKIISEIVYYGWERKGRKYRKVSEDTLEVITPRRWINIHFRESSLRTKTTFIGGGCTHHQNFSVFWSEMNCMRNTFAR